MSLKMLVRFALSRPRIMNLFTLWLEVLDYFLHRINHNIIFHYQHGFQWQCHQLCFPPSEYDGIAIETCVHSENNSVVKAVKTMVLHRLLGCKIGFKHS